MPQSDIIHFLRQYESRRVALVVHARPDGDALGSGVGLAACLAQAGYQAVVVNPLPLPSYLNFLVDPDLVIRHDAFDWWRGYDCLGLLDCGDADRLESVNQSAIGKLPTFTIDHHATSKGVGDAIWIEKHASSTGEMIVRLAREAGWPISRKAAQALWTAIVTDTGRFCYENTSEAALDAARECVKAGANPSEAAMNLYQSVTVAERRLELIVLERMQLLESGRLAVSWLRRDDFRRAGSGVEGASNLINLLRDTEGVEVAVFLYEPPGNDSDPYGPVKVSMRTRSPYDALEVVCRFGGGGHQRAAGCTLPGPPEAARGRVLEAVVDSFFTKQ